MPKVNAVLVLSLLLALEMTGFVSVSSPNVSALANPPDLLVSVETNKKAYAKGEPVGLTVILSNLGPVPATLHFSTTCQSAFVVEDSSRVWYDERLHILCGQALTEITVSPGQSVMYSFTWKQVDDAGNQVPVPHGLLVRGIILHTDDIPPLEGTTAIRLENGGSAPMAAFTWAPCVFCLAPGNVVFFNANVSVGSIVRYTWDFGDGSAPINTTDPFTTHIFFSSLPTVTVSLTELDARGMTDSVRHQISFNIVPRYSFRPEKPATGDTVTFNASASMAYGPKIVGFNWDFGDGATGTGELASHLYASPGIYRVILTIITDDGGFSMSKAIVVTVRGDVNGDCSVTIVDLALIGLAFGSTRTDPNWNPDADVNHDLVVDIMDAAVGALNFGRSCP